MHKRLLLIVLAACNQQTPTDAPPIPAIQTPPQQAPDWEHALDVSAARTPTGATVTIDVHDGFHVYGAAEQTSRPLKVEVDAHADATAVIPQGQAKAVAGVQTPAHVLTGRIDVPVTVPDATGDLQGRLSYQVCTDTICSMPTTRPWQAKAAH